MYFGAKVIILRSGKKYLMEKTYTYFDRNVSWLSFNYRVLLEAEDINMPIYERLMFLSIHASNLEEFYKIRVAEHRSIILKKICSEEDPAEAELILARIREEVTRQQTAFFDILSGQILPELERQGIILYINEPPKPFHETFVRNYFNEEVFPFLQPVLLLKDDIRFFIRDNRIYQVVQLRGKNSGKRYYSIIKIPYAKVPRFVELPKYEGKYYYMFAEDIIAYNLSQIFTGYEVEGSYNIKISRDADIYIDEETNKTNIVETIIKKVKKRKIGDLSRFAYDKRMSVECLTHLCETFSIHPGDLIPGQAYLSMEDFRKLPNPTGKDLCEHQITPIPIRILDDSKQMATVIRQRDIFFNHPYHSFNYFTRLLKEASVSDKVKEIKLTQYRVAEDSAVVNSLLDAARNGISVTVFVELKARFDEEHNLSTAMQMKEAGIKIIYSIPGLKVHAKVALIIEKGDNERNSYAYLSTGNFNEETAKRYSDMAIMTSDPSLTGEIEQLFKVLETRNTDVRFHTLRVAGFNMIDSLKEMIAREIEHVRQGKKAYIVLKMNGLQDPNMIDELYMASEAGVEIDLIVRGICCLKPDQPYSRNIRVTRIVDQFLEHSRIWYFYNDGKEDLFLTSADWMKRNLYRRIETAFPILDEDIKQLILRILKIQLADNVKACFIDAELNNVFKTNNDPEKVWAQRDTYKLLKSLTN